jgi:hypothetical protein
MTMSELPESADEERANESTAASATNTGRPKTLLMFAGGLLVLAAVIGTLVPTVFLNKDSGSSTDPASLQVSRQKLS